MLATYIDPRWVLVMLGSAAAFGSLSPLIQARRLSYFAASLPHSALLSVTLGYIASVAVGGHPALWAVAFSLPLSAMLMYFVHRGVSEDSATSAFVAFTVSGSVAAVYYVLTNYPARVSLWSYILGDPLLSTWEDAAIAAAMGVLTVALTSRLILVEVSIGMDSEFAASSGIKVSLHNYLLASLLTVTAVGLLKIVGFVLEHVVLLMPGAAAAIIARSAREFYLLSVVFSLSASALGLALSILLNIAPAAMTGFVLLAFYLAALALGGGR
ncbi:MAG: metal ABC transporter permease [Thermofilum sp.]